MDRGNLKVIITFIIIIHLSKCTLIINIRGNTLLIDLTIYKTLYFIWYNMYNLSSVSLNYTKTINNCEWITVAYNYRESLRFYYNYK